MLTQTKKIIMECYLSVFWNAIYTVLLIKKTTMQCSLSLFWDAIYAALLSFITLAGIWCAFNNRVRILQKKATFIDLNTAKNQKKLIQTT